MKGRETERERYTQRKIDLPSNGLLSKAQDWAMWSGGLHGGGRGQAQACFLLVGRPGFPSWDKFLVVPLRVFSGVDMIL